MEGGIFLKYYRYNNTIEAPGPTTALTRIISYKMGGWMDNTVVMLIVTI